MTPVQEYISVGGLCKNIIGESSIKRTRSVKMAASYLPTLRKFWAQKLAARYLALSGFLPSRVLRGTLLSFWANLLEFLTIMVFIGPNSVPIQKIAMQLWHLLSVVGLRVLDMTAISTRTLSLLFSLSIYFPCFPTSLTSSLCDFSGLWFCFMSPIFNSETFEFSSLLAHLHEMLQDKISYFSKLLSISSR